MSVDQGPVRRAGNRRRSPAVAQQLKARQQRRNEQRAAEWERLKRIEDAYKAFELSFGAIEETKLATAKRVAALNKQIAETYEQEKEAIAAEECNQALAAAAIRAEVGSVDDVAAHLQISVTAVRHLLKMVRPSAEPASSSAPKTEKPAPHDRSRHSGDRNGGPRDHPKALSDAARTATPTPGGPAPVSANGLRGDTSGEATTATVFVPRP